MFVLGENDKYISPQSVEYTATGFPKMRVEVVPNASYFLQYQAATATNKLLRDFLSPASDFSI